MSALWVDPDLVDDPRHERLAPALAVSNRTGLPNWRYIDPEFKLRFIANPGKEFGHSEGMDYVARFLEKETGEPFASLVATGVFKPIGIDDMRHIRSAPGIVCCMVFGDPVGCVSVNSA